VASIFLSYSRQDVHHVQLVEPRLREHGVSVWRDQEKLYAGQKWPKALGEAIAANDCLLLLWSKNAAKSEYVELEWCTALALRKTIVPCLLDDTPLPASLTAIHAVGLNEIGEAILKILTAPAQQSGQADEAQTRNVMSQMAKIAAREPREVLRQVKATFAQNQWTVHGPVYQAKGDIHISSPPPAQSQKTLLEKWQTWVALIVGMLTAITLLTQLLKEKPIVSKPKETASQQNAQVLEQSLAGSILDETGEPLFSAKVSLLLSDKEWTTVTDDLGRFKFRVTAPLEEEVTLIAQKDGYRTEKRYTHLGNPGFNFKMRRKEQ
jgi:TIR domain